MTKRQIWMLVAAALAGAILLLAFYTVFIEPYNFQVTHNSFRLFDGKGQPVKIILISDIHEAYNYPDYWKRAVDRINAEDADLILIDGDIVSSTHEENLDKLSMLGSLHARYGVYATLGNHDYQYWGCPLDADSAKFARAVVEQLREANVTVLRNENRALTIRNQTFALVGLDDEWVCKNDYPAATATLSAAMPRVVMAHEQTAVSEASLVGSNLVLSGHTHCGQVNIPFFTAWALEFVGFGPHIGGRVELKDGNFQYIGCGLTPGKARFNAPPEISVIELD